MVHSDGARHEPSAQADIAVSQPRFQSPGAGGTLTIVPRHATLRSLTSSDVNPYSGGVGTPNRLSSM
jgi:hypothetical protein